MLETLEGAPIAVRGKQDSYLGAWLDPDALKRILKVELDALGVSSTELPESLRVRQVEDKRFVFNYGREEKTFEGQAVPAAGVLILE